MAGLISPATLEQIRAASDIVDVIGAVLPLKRAGANFVTLCPFHREKTPSFNVNAERGFFYCFGCHASGNVISFIQQLDGLTFPEAVRELAERAGAEVGDVLELTFDVAAGTVTGRRQLSNEISATPPSAAKLTTSRYCVVPGSME